VSIYEALGIGYVVLCTAIFSAEMIYFALKGLNYVHRLINRAQTEENIDLQRTLSIKQELAKVD
jgi:hypothetical protein